MKRRTRSRRHGGNVRGMVLGAVVFCLALGGLGVVLVWHENRNKQLRAELSVKRHELLRLQGLRQDMEHHLQQLLTPDSLLAALRRFGSNLGPPRPDQYLVLPEPTVPQPPISPAARMTAQNERP